MSVVPPLAVAIVLATAGAAPARDCGGAATATDRAICRDHALAQRDDATTALFRKVERSAASPVVRAALLRQQDAWLARRDATCRPPEPSCLAAQDREREDQLTALSASVAAAGGRLDAAVPVILRGSWTSEPILDPGRPDKAAPADTAQALDLADLPRPGETVKAGPGRLCIAAEPCETVGWSATTVEALPGGDRIARDLGLAAGSPAYTGGTGSPRSAFTLVPRGARDLVAVFGLCGPNATDCRTAYEPWRPADAGSRFE